VVDAADGAVRVMYSADGGIDIEQAARSGRIEEPLLRCKPCWRPRGNRGARRRHAALRGADLPSVAEKLAELLFEKELLLAEINPLFCTPDGAVRGRREDRGRHHALERQGDLRAFVDHRPQIYRDTWRKVHEGFDFIDLDDGGSIGLVTTGAGLSMMLIDELVSRGGAPVNFCDIRTGQFRGRPDRLIRVLEWLAEKKNLRVVFVNIFAGITDSVNSRAC